MIITDKAQIKIAKLRESNNLRLSGSDELECYELIESDLKLPADATFTRSSIAYLSDGTQVAANQPRFEQGKFGKAVMVEEGTVNRTDPNNPGTAWHSDWSVEVIAPRTFKITALKDNPGRNTYFVGVLSTGYSAAANESVTLSCEIVECSNPYIYVYCNGFGQMQAGNWGTLGNRVWRTITHSSSWNYRLGIDVDNANLQYIRQGDYIIVKDIQIEAKPYPTSFTDGTRANEKLTIPIEVLNHNAFTFEMWIKQSIVTTSAFIHGNLFLDLGQGLWLWNFCPAWSDPESHNRRIIAEFGSDVSGTRQYRDLISQTPFSTVNFEHFAITFDGATFHFYRNGVLWDSVKPSKINPFTQIVLGSAGWIIDDLRISSIARSDEEILAAYQSGKPLLADEWTTYKIDFDDKVRITTQGQIICNELIEI